MQSNTLLRGVACQRLLQHTYAGLGWVGHAAQLHNLLPCRCVGSATQPTRPACAGAEVWHTAVAPATKHDQLVVVWVIHCHMAVATHRPVTPCWLQVPLHAFAGHPEQFVADRAIPDQLSPKHVDDVVHLHKGSAVTVGTLDAWPFSTSRDPRCALRGFLIADRPVSSWLQCASSTCCPL